MMAESDVVKRVEKWVKHRQDIKDKWDNLCKKYELNNNFREVVMERIDDDLAEFVVSEFLKDREAHVRHIVSLLKSLDEALKSEGFDDERLRGELVKAYLYTI